MISVFSDPLGMCFALLVLVVVFVLYKVLGREGNV